MRPSKYSKEQKKQYLDILRQNMGLVTHACQQFGIARETHYTWYKIDEWFKTEVDNIEKTNIEFVESKLYQLINQGNDKAILFYLKTKGRKFGYGDNVDISVHSDVVEFKFLNEAINTNILPPTSIQQLLEPPDDEDDENEEDSKDLGGAPTA